MQAGQSGQKARAAPAAAAPRRAMRVAARPRPGTPETQAVLPAAARSPCVARLARVRLQCVARTVPAAAAPRRATLTVLATQTAQTVLATQAHSRAAQVVRVPLPRRQRVRRPLARPVTARQALA
jgi:hypothetical protein